MSIYVPTEIGLEKFCTRCKELWPTDLEFFGPQPSGRFGLSSQCRACLAVSRQESRVRTGSSRRRG